MSSPTDIINVPVEVTRRQLLALGWKNGDKIASREEFREFVSELFIQNITPIESEYRAWKKGSSNGNS